jgi:hypothetical protein
VSTPRAGGRFRNESQHARTPPPAAAAPLAKRHPGRRRTASSPWPPTTVTTTTRAGRRWPRVGVPPHPVLAYLLVACGCCSSVGWSASPRPAIPPRRDTTGRAQVPADATTITSVGTGSRRRAGSEGMRAASSHGTSLAARGWSPRMQQRQPVVDDEGRWPDAVERRSRLTEHRRGSASDLAASMPVDEHGHGSPRPRPPCPPTSTPTWIGNTPTRPRTGCPTCSSWTWDLALTYSARRAVRRALTSGHSSFTTL